MFGNRMRVRVFGQLLSTRPPELLSTWSVAVFGKRTRISLRTAFKSAYKLPIRPDTTASGPYYSHQQIFTRPRVKCVSHG